MQKVILVLSTVLVLQVASFGAAVFDKNLTYKPGHNMAPVTFSHKFHLSQKAIKDCKVCHPSIFAKMKAGANKVQMAEINKGKFCGVCHNEKGKAFKVAGNCARCHVKSQS